MNLFQRFRRTEEIDYTEDVQAARELHQVHKAWAFIYDCEAPENFDRGVRALLLQGVPATRIIGAMTIAAMKPNIADADQWAYLCGVIRNEQVKAVAV